MTTKTDRLLEFINHLGISKYKFANSIDASKSLVTKLTTQKDVNYGVDFLEKILIKYPTFNVTWLLTGKGGMFVQEVGHDNETTEHHAYVSDLIKETKQSKYYQYVNELSFKLLPSYSNDFKMLITSLNQHWELSMLFMQFIKQYDKYVTDSTFHFELYKTAKDLQLSKEEFQDYITNLFDNIKRITPIIQVIDKHILQGLEKLKEFDIEKMLISTDWKDAQRAYLENDWVALGGYDLIFNLERKLYPGL